MRAVVYGAMVLLAGCVSSPQEATTLAEEPRAQVWSDSPWSLSLPEGDSYGILRISNLTPHEVGGASVYGLVVDASSLEGLSHVAFYQVEASEPVIGWSGGYAWAEDPGEIILEFVVHATRAGDVLIGPLVNEESEIVGEPVEAQWLATGAAEVSYYVSGILVNALSVEDSSYGFTVTGTGVPPNGLAAAGALQFRSSHTGSSTKGMQYAASILLVTGAGAGTFETTLGRNEGDLSVTSPFAGPTPAPGLLAFVGALISAPAVGETSFEIGLTGGAAVHNMLLYHFSVPFDLASVGVAVEEKFTPLGIALPVAEKDCLLQLHACMLVPPAN